MAVPSEGSSHLTSFLRGLPLADDVPKRASKAAASTPEPKRASRTLRRRRPRAAVRHGTRDFILKTLEGTANGPALGTMAIIKEVRKLAEKRIPEETVRSSLKTLVRQRLAKGRKHGHEKTYKLIASAPPEAGAPPVQGSRALATRGEPRAEITAAELAVIQPLGPHKLAVGEILLITVGETHVESASNVHGKLVLEKHPRPR